jgi:hypothetical protein
MTETIFIDLADEGEMGARVTVYGQRPRACPGLGGWKKDEDGGWWTRVKSPQAADLLTARAPGNPCMGLRVTPGGRIDAVATMSGEDIMTYDIEDAESAGDLTWRTL